ncbi:MAG: hypothetical protein JNL82_21190 [Myxococcales bacterium]|nr:hypothetical protein [Myxococcales bacterium]
MHPRAHADLPRRLAARPHPIPTTSSRAHPTGTSFHSDATPRPARTSLLTSRPTAVPHPAPTSTASLLASRPTVGPHLIPSTAAASRLASRPTAGPHLSSSSSCLASRSPARLARLLRFVLVLAALPLVALTALPAAAKCMLPGPALTPGAGTVPARPVLRLLMPARGAPDGLPRVIARLGGKQVPVTVTADTAAGDLRAYRVVVTAATAGKLEISLQNDHGDTTRTWTLAVDPRWRPPASKAPGDRSRRGSRARG